MQRVLSFQMARGFGESSEFVTKRMCFSFLFSVGFLCLLCGFLLGRFAAERSVEYRAEKRRIEYFGNGLDSIEYIARQLHQELEMASSSFDDYILYSRASFQETNNIEQAKDILSNLSFFRSIVVNETSAIVKIDGSRESDRYVMLSSSGEGIDIAIEFAKTLQGIHARYNWKPRRTLIICVFFGTRDPCAEMLPTAITHNIIGYVAIHGDVLQGGDYLTVSGSDVIQSFVLDIINDMSNVNFYSSYSIMNTSNLDYNKIIPPRLRLDIPHAILSFVNNNSVTDSQYGNIKSRRIVLACIIAETIWRLSESLVIKWKPKYFNKAINELIQIFPDVGFQKQKEEIERVLIALTTNAEILYKKADTLDITQPLGIRILNDLIMHVDRALLCLDGESRSKTELSSLISNRLLQSSIISVHLNDTISCYKNAVRILKDW